MIFRTLLNCWCIRTAIKLLGVRSASRLFLTIARSLVGVFQEKVPDATLFHSIVVDEGFRGQGLGKQILAELERIASQNGYPWAILQVLEQNAEARRFYLKYGCEDIWKSPGWMAALS
jgi:ribosomal protein S18 acetylase RimI-like enzyme